MYLYIFNMIGSEYNIITVIPFKELSLFLLLGFIAIGIVTGVIAAAFRCASI